MSRRWPDAPEVMLLVTCEHGGNRVPPEYRRVFAGHAATLASHRAFDPGALALAKDVARTYGAPLVAATVTRLLVELNRSLHHGALFSELTRALPPEEKERIVARYYMPYRLEVERHARDAVASGRSVLHLSAHSFTPVLHGETRTADVALLYDPKRVPERLLCERWSAALGSHIAPLRVRRNYPYRGYDDGLTTFLRSRFAPERYLGVEIEVNQQHVLAGGAPWRALRRRIVASVSDALASMRG